MMKMEEAMRLRHTVRSYHDKKLPESFVDVINERIAEINQRYRVEFKLIVNDSHVFNPIIRILVAKGVKNYVVMAGNKDKTLEERIGYAGADLMLYAQTLGLNTWWVGATYRKWLCERKVKANKVLGIIALGYGKTQGNMHKSKNFFEVSSYSGDETPSWFKAGVEAALFAPTAKNRQKFFIKGKGSYVHIHCDNGSYTGCDLGLLKYHFELGAGKENFSWTNEEVL